MMSEIWCLNERQWAGALRREGECYLARGDGGDSRAGERTMVARVVTRRSLQRDPNYRRDWESPRPTESHLLRSLSPLMSFLKDELDST